MSVLVADIKVYEAIYHKMVSYTFINQVNINFCSVFHRMKEEEIRDFVKNLCNLNEYSYNKKYNETAKKMKQLLTEPLKLSTFINFSFQDPKINTYQMLKYLQMIRYNIEVKSPVLEKLDDAIREISNQIIDQLPQYKEAKWSEI